MKKAKNEVDNAEQRVCKKCGEPLTSQNKHKYCDNCRRERAKARREALGAAGGLCLMAISLVPGVKHFAKK